jgi:hypothetical protein
MGKADLRIDWATHEAAKYACVNWHYSGTVPSPLSKPFKVGAWENGKFIGVVIYTVGVSAALNAGYGISRQEVCELQRVALTRHKSSVSKIVSISLKFLKKANPKLRLVVSFADQFQGHHGGIYQAGNWIYSGETDSGVAYFDKTGRQVHPRNVGLSEGYDASGVKKYAKADLRMEGRPGKHRYLMPLDADMRARIMPLSKPYPKRAKQAMTDDQLAQRQCSTDPHAPIQSEAP